MTGMTRLYHLRCYRNLIHEITIRTYKHYGNKPPKKRVTLSQLCVDQGILNFERENLTHADTNLTRVICQQKICTNHYT